MTINQRVIFAEDGLIKIGTVIGLCANLALVAWDEGGEEVWIDKFRLKTGFTNGVLQ